MNAVSSATRRIQLQPAYLLHHRPYRDTSRILELFTRDYGRITVFARGARGGKRASSVLNSVLQPFHRILVSWSGRGEAGQLTGAEFDGAYVELAPGRMLSGYYLNELLLRLFERHDAHLDMFALYDATLQHLKIPDCEEAATLRIFEKRLLEALGYGLSLASEVSGAPIVAEQIYRYRIEEGATRIDGVADAPLSFVGRSLLALAAEDLSAASVRADARRLLRAALDRYLDGRALHSREVLLGLRRMQESKGVRPGT
ncbi:MAG: DNA repair protein RecO [Candidatus Obscuribacterales bacterium]|nr:DNA repair protein RecO [Steroidobacteraceae bacterium]